MTGTGPIPASWAEVTPEWISTVLDADVAAVEVLFADDGTNRRARLGLTYRSGSGPAVVFAKAEGEHREVHARNGNLFNEADLFASGADLPLDRPAVYGVVIDRPALDYLLLMEDITERGGDPRDSTRPMTPAQVSSGLVSLARLHAAHWGWTAEREPDLGWVQTWEATEGWQVGLRRMIPVGLERASSAWPDEIRTWSADDIVDLWVAFVDSLDVGPMTLLHGDAHIGNTYVLPDDTVGFLDWQVVRRGNWSQDVGYFLQGALTTEERRGHERELVATYVAELGQVDGDEAWLRYRASAVYGLAIWLSTLGTDGYQTQEVSLALVERYAAAAIDLDSVGALGQLAESRDVRGASGGSWRAAMTTPQVRRIQFDFSGDVPFCWQPANPEFALMMNMIGLMIVGFEKYVVDAVRDAIPRISDPDARLEGDVFLRQEAQHARAHRMHLKALFRQYPGMKQTMDDVIAEYDRLFAEKPLQYHLAYIADLEATFTPVFKQILDNADELFEAGDERVASLFLWHFTEEIEHRSSALIVYDAVVPAPWYRLGQLPSVLRHMGKILRMTADGINEHVPIEDRLVDARNILPGRQTRRSIGEQVSFLGFLARDIDLGYPSALGDIPQDVQMRTNLRILASQVPHHDPEHQPLPPFAAEWIERYDRGDDVSHWFSSQDA